MRIAYIYDAVWPFTKGGLELRVYELARRLAKRGHEVDVYGWWLWKGGRKVILPEGAALHSLGSWNRSLYNKNGKRSIAEGVYFGWRTLLRSYKDYNIVDSQQFPYFNNFSAKLRANHNFVITFVELWGTQYWREYLGGVAGRMGELIERGVTKLAKHNVSISEHTRQRLMNEGVDSTVIPCGIDFSRILSVPRSKEQTDIIFVGRLIHEKNVDMLLDAVGTLKQETTDVSCTIIGNGPEKERLEHKAKELNLTDNVRFLGRLEHYEDVLAHIKAASVLAIPSFREGFGIVALEANACGIPFITVNHPMNAITELCIDGNGYACKPSTSDLALCLQHVLDKGIGNNQNIANQDVARYFDWNHIANMAERYYAEVAGL